MSEVTATLRADNFRAHHVVGVVGTFDNGTGFAGIKAWPAAAGVVLVLGGKEDLVATTAGEDTVAVDVQERSGKGWFGRGFAKDRVTITSELSLPLFC